MSLHFTGAGIVSPLGQCTESTVAALRSGSCAVQAVPEWSETDGLSTAVAAFVSDFDGRFVPRKTRRTMSKMSLMLCRAADEALAQAGLSPGSLNERRVMLIVGSTTGSTGSFETSFKKFHETASASGQFSTTMFKTMNHSVALNLASYLGFKGAVLSPASACSTGAQAILLGAEFIRAGLCDIALCGGADEAHVGTAIAFDTAQAASSAHNSQPEKASRPFDHQRDGVVVSEGAALTVLESEASLRERHQESLGQLLGWSQSCDGGSIAHSSAASMAANMQVALEMAGLKAEHVGYVNAHATSTRLGDLFEAQAVEQVFGRVPISSLKGHMGHSFAPCGTLEAIVTLEMLRSGRLVPTLNLEQVDPEMPGLDYVAEPRAMDKNIAMSNNFAMGGMNVSLLLATPGATP